MLAVATASHFVAPGTSRQFAASQQSVAVGLEADIWSGSNRRRDLQECLLVRAFEMHTWLRIQIRDLTRRITWNDSSQKLCDRPLIYLKTRKMVAF